MVPDIEWIETLVTLVRQDTGFGFRVVGGTEEGSQVGFLMIYINPYNYVFKDLTFMHCKTKPSQH